MAGARKRAERPRRTSLDSRGPRGRASSAELPRHFAVALALIAFVGGGISLKLTQLRHELLEGGEGGALCTAGTTLDCGSVLLSTYSSIGDLPLSAIAAWFYALTFAIAFMAVGRPSGRLPRSPAAMLTALYGLAVVTSAILACISIFALGAVCALCASLYAVNLFGLLVAWRALRDTDETLGHAIAQEPSYWRERPRRAIVVAVALVVSLLSLAVAGRAPVHGSEICERLASASSDRPLSLVVFSDFQCTHCRTLHRALRPVRDNPNIHLTLRHYPLESTCNPRVSGVGHLGACLQAKAAICAERQHAPAYADRLFELEPTEMNSLVAVAQTVGLDASVFAGCLQADITAAALRADVSDAASHGIHATPSVVFEGRLLPGRLSATDIRCLATYSGS